jgi:hypothetical protein
MKYDAEVSYNARIRFDLLWLFATINSLAFLDNTTTRTKTNAGGNIKKKFKNSIVLCCDGCTIDRYSHP